MSDATFFEHNTIDGDRWDLLAYQYYGDADQQSVLVAANRDLFLDPVAIPAMILPAGLTLIVPVIAEDAPSDGDLPPWKRAQASYD